MPMQIDEFLSAADKVPDSVELPFKVGETEEKITMGDLRARFAATQRERDEAKATASTLEQTMETLRKAREAQAAEQQTQRRLTPEGVRTEPVDDMAAAWEGTLKLDDPYSKVMQKKILDAANKLVEERLNGVTQQNQNQFTAAARLLARLTAQSEFKDYEWPKDYSPKRAYEEAAQRGYLNKETGFPDLGRLNHEITEPMRMEKEKKSAYDAGFAAAEKKIREEMADQNRSRFKVVSGGNAVTGAGRRMAEGQKPTNLRGVFDSMEITPEDLAAAALSAGGLVRGA